MLKLNIKAFVKVMKENLTLSIKKKGCIFPSGEESFDHD